MFLFLVFAVVGLLCVVLFGEYKVDTNMMMRRMRLWRELEEKEDEEEKEKEDEEAVVTVTVECVEE